VRNRIEVAERFRAEEAGAGRNRLFIGSDVEMSRRVREDLTERLGRIVHVEGGLWRYVGAHREEIPDHALRRSVHACDDAWVHTPAGAPSNVELTNTRVNSVLNECVALCAEPRYFEKPPAGINCGSDLIRFDAEGRRHLDPR
jgi:hypothetical protein